VSSSSVPGTNVPPISFPGITSGIDYNSIIKQLTSMSLAPTVSLNASIATLNNANIELIKINNLLQAVQTSLQTLSNPDIYNAYEAVSSNPSVAIASGIAGSAAVPGSYTIAKVVTATSTSVTSAVAAGHSITDALTAGPYAGSASNTVPLASSYAAVKPTNGGSLGQITIDGVSISYNVNTQSLDQILAAIQSGVQAGADAGFTATLVGGKVTFTSSDQSISLGSSSDSGNILDVLKLSDAQLNNTSTSGSIAGTSDVGGISDTASFSDTNGGNFVTPVTSGYFMLNGAKITVSSGDNVADVLKAINASSAGVIATYSQDTNQITLTATKTGPQGIVLGAAGDTSNFLAAAGLTSASGAAIQVGTQSEVDLQTANGGTQKYFGNSNTVTSVIPGISLSLQSGSTSPFVVTVAQTTSQLTSAVSSFVSTYNAAVSEIDAATAPPVVLPAAVGSGGASKSVGGGVLFGNANAQQIVSQLTNIVGGFLGSGNSYNSLSQLGLALSDSFQTLTTSNNSSATGDSGGQGSGQSNQTVQSTTFQGTDGTLQQLNLTKFEAAFTANPSAIADLLNGSNGLTTVLGSYLSTATGTPTILDSGIVGTTPTVSIIQNFENTNTDAIQSFQQQVQQLTDNANQQANNLRAQFVASESMISQLQSEQQQLAAALGFSVSSSSSGS
jgi:flagellar hook-associated protein 2